MDSTSCRLFSEPLASPRLRNAGIKSKKVNEIYHDDCLYYLFNPRSIAIVGATDKPGLSRQCVENLMLAGKFRIYPVNPGREKCLGLDCYRSVSSCPEIPDLIVVVVPAPAVPGVIEEAAKLGVNAAIVFSAGFKEIGKTGIELEKKIFSYLAESKTRVCGPNCFGAMCPSSRLNATFGSWMAKEGNVAFATQSGGMMTSIGEWACTRKIGFSHFISVGSMLDIDWADLFCFFLSDPKTKFVICYMEGLGNAPKTMAAMTELAVHKPVIVLKPGRSIQAREAASSHTGSLCGSDVVVDAAFKRAGVIRVDSISDVFMMAEVLPKVRLPKGPNLAILTQAGGPGVLAADAVYQHGGRLAKLSRETLDKLDLILPKHWSQMNPVDTTGMATPSTFESALNILADDPEVDGILVVLAASLIICSPLSVAKVINFFVKQTKFPVITCFMGGDEALLASQTLEEMGSPVFLFADDAARSWTMLTKYKALRDYLYSFPPELNKNQCFSPSRVNQVNFLLEEVRNSGRLLLTEEESKNVLSLYNLPVCHTYPASTSEIAIEKADLVGYPVVVKLWSNTITHKAKVGGVILNVEDKKQVKTAFETIKENIMKLENIDHDKAFLGVTVQKMINMSGLEVLIGASTDPDCGRVIAFGHGGSLVEIIADTAVDFPPLSLISCRKLIQSTKIYEGLANIKGIYPSVDIDALESHLLSFSLMIHRNPSIKEVDINPMICSADGFAVVDARIVLFGKDEERPRDLFPCIMNYLYETIEVSNVPYVIRSLYPEDLKIWLEVHNRWSEDLWYTYFGQNVPKKDRINQSRYVEVMFANPHKYGTFVCIRESRIVAVARVRWIHGHDRENQRVARFCFLCECEDLGESYIDSTLEMGIKAAKNLGYTLLECIIPHLRHGTQFPLGNIFIQYLLRKGFFETSSDENGSTLLVYPIR